MSTRIACISDCHNLAKHLLIPDCDLLVMAGDMTQDGTPEELRNLNMFIDKLGMKKENVLYVPGNHDIWFHQYESLARELVSHATVLIDQYVERFGLKIYGTPWVPKCWGAFTADEPELYRRFSRIPDDLDLLITHGPPQEILDTTEGFRLNPIGSYSLRVRLYDMHGHRPKNVVFGHIHSGRGFKRDMDINFFNVANCDEQNRIVHNPVLIEVSK